MNSKPMTPVLVIGAGLSGLACAQALARRGIPPTVLEAEGRVAEPWRARHPALRLNIHRHFAGLPGLKAPSSDGAFLRRDTVVAHLERYARSLDVPIRFGVEVGAVARSAGGWRVSTTAGPCETAHVVIASGRDRVPHIPDWPGREAFGAELLHVAELGDVARFDGKRVLVVGAGNSGSDALNHLARHRPKEVLIAVRHGPALVPARIFGFPLHRLARVFAALPSGLLDPAFRAVQRLFLGNLERHGLRSHPAGGGTRLIRDGVAFAIDDGFVAALRSGRFRMVHGVERFEPNGVRLADGSICTPDVVVAATGYRSGLAPLLGHLGVLDEEGRPRHPMGEPDPRNPGLWFSGFRPTFTGYFDAAAIAAERIAAGVAADARRTLRQASGLQIRGVASERAASADAAHP